MNPIITLTTDFGLADSYVGQMKGVILSVQPDATLVDLSHEVAPQDVTGAAYLLESALDAFPDGVVHVVVVDPGVGSERRPVAVRWNGGFCVGPDNGVFSLALRGRELLQAVTLDQPQYHRRPTSRTFHGRDIFAPASAHLARGVDMLNLGSPVAELHSLEGHQPVEREGGLDAHVVDVDRFGNLVTDLHEDRLLRAMVAAGATGVKIELGEITIDRISGTFSDVEPGEPVAYIGSRQRLELAIREGHAGYAWKVKRGMVVRVNWRL